MPESESGFQDVTQGIQPPEAPAPELPPDFAQPKFDPKWKVKKRKMQGRGNEGKLLPKPATKKEAKDMVKKLAVEAVAMVAQNADIPTATIEKYGRITHQVKAHILSYLGEDIEAAKQEFQKELLANARQVSQHIMGEFQDYPPSVKAFCFTAFIDKAQALEAKSGVSAAGAKVSQNINVFMDGAVDREKIMAQLTGQAYQPAPIPVSASVDGAGNNPSPSAAG